MLRFLSLFLLFWLKLKLIREKKKEHRGGKKNSFVIWDLPCRFMVQVVLLPLSRTTTLVAAMAATFWGQIGHLKQLTTLSRCFVMFSPQNAVTQNNFKRLPAQQQPGVRSLCRYAREKKCNLGTYASPLHGCVNTLVQENL